MEKTRITIKEGVRQKSTEQVNREGDTVAEITKEGEIR
jgi:hypothetical protein